MVEIVEWIYWILSVDALPLEHDRGIVGSMQAPMLFHRVEAGEVVVSCTSLTKEG